MFVFATLILALSNKDKK
ncbi:hypothetical protein [Lactococcus lactis]